MANQTSSEHEFKVDVRSANASLDSTQARLDKVLETIEKINKTPVDPGSEDKKRRARRGALAGGITGGAMTVGAGVSAGAVGGMAGSPAAVYAGAGMVGAGAGRMLGATIKGLSDVAGKLSEHAGGFLKTALKGFGKQLDFVGAFVEKGAKIFGLGMTALGMIAQQRLGVAHQRAALDRAGMFASLSGGGRPSLTAGVQLGMGPQEAAAQASAASMAAGYAGSMRGVGLFSMMRTGMSAGGVGGLAGAAGANRQPGAGTTATFVRRAVSAGVQDGLRGSRLEQAVSQLGGAITGAGQAGMRTDLGELGALAYSLTGAAVSAGAPAGTGFRTAATLANLPVQAKQSILAPFQGVGQALTLAEAARRSRGGGMDALLGELETMGAGGALEGLQRGGAASRYFLAQGAPIGAVDDLLAATTEGVPRAPGIPGLARAGAAARAKASAEADTMRTMGSVRAASLISAMGRLQAVLQNIAGNLDGLTTKLPEILTVALRKAVQKN